MNRRVHGLRAWVWQRVSAVYLAAFTLYLAGHLLFCAPATYEAWRSWVAGPVVSALVVIFFIMLFLHAWVGMRDVIMDYVHPLVVRAVMLLLLGVGLLASGVWVARILAMAWMTA